MGDGNWIKLNRDIMESFIWSFDDPKRTLAWLEMLMMANYKDKKILFDGKTKVIERGSFVTSFVALAERWKMDRRTVKKLFETLQEEGLITFQSDNRCTTVFLCNYKAEQDLRDSECTTECTAECTTECTTECTQHKKVKTVKDRKDSKESTNIVHFPKAEIDEFFEKVWDLYPVKKGKGQVSEAKRKALYSIGYEELARAVDRYKAGLRRESWRKPQNGGTFFNSGYVDYLDKNYKEDLTNGIYDGHSGDYKETGRIGNYL